MKIFIYILLVLFTSNSFSQYFIPFGRDSLYRNDEFGVIYDIYVNNNDLYVGGFSFEYGSNNVELNDIAKYDTSSWQALDNGMVHTGWNTINTIIKYKNYLYIGTYSEIPNIPNTNHISRFNGTTWEALPNSLGANGVSNSVNDLTIWNNQLIIGGGVQTIGSTYYNMPFVVAYDGTDYIDINDGDININVFDVEVYNNELYSTSDHVIKKYIGNKQWEQVGGFFSHYVKKMLVDTFNNFLYVVGAFHYYNSTIPTDFVCIWDGYKYTGIGNGEGDQYDVTAIAIYRGDIYVNCGGDSIGGVYTGHLAKWNGTTWEPGVPGGIKYWVNSLAVYNDQLWIGGGAPNDGVNVCPFDTARKTLSRWYLPPTINCNYLQPRIQSHTDTFFVNQAVQIHNNNAYVDSWQWDFGDGSSNATIQNPYHTYTDTGTYTVSLEVNWQTCNKTIQRTFVVVEDTGTKIQNTKNAEQGFRVYPNPANNSLNLDIPDGLNFQDIQILDINGKVVRVIARKNDVAIPTKKEQIATSQAPRNDVVSLNISNLQKGTYIIKIGNQTQRFIKE